MTAKCHLPGAREVAREEAALLEYCPGTPNSLIYGRRHDSQR